MIPQQQILDRYDTIPISLKEVIFSFDNVELLNKICGEQHLSSDKTGLVSEIVGYVLFGFVQADDLGKEIKGALGVNAQIADAIASEIDKKIFAPIRGDLEKVYKPVTNENDTDVRMSTNANDARIDVVSVEPLKTSGGEKSALSTLDSGYFSKPKNSGMTDSEQVSPIPEDAVLDLTKNRSTDNNDNDNGGREGEIKEKSPRSSALNPRESASSVEEGPFILHEEKEMKPTVITGSEKRSLGGFLGFFGKKDKKSEEAPIRATVEGIGFLRGDNDNKIRNNNYNDNNNKEMRAPVAPLPLRTPVIPAPVAQAPISVARAASVSPILPTNAGPKIVLGDGGNNDNNSKEMRAPAPPVKIVHYSEKDYRDVNKADVADANKIVPPPPVMQAVPVSKPEPLPKAVVDLKAVSSDANSKDVKKTIANNLPAPDELPKHSLPAQVNLSVPNLVIQAGNVRVENSDNATIDLKKPKEAGTPSINDSRDKTEDRKVESETLARPDLSEGASQPAPVVLSLGANNANANPPVVIMMPAPPVAVEGGGGKGENSENIIVESRRADQVRVNRDRLAQILKKGLGNEGVNKPAPPRVIPKEMPKPVSPDEEMIDLRQL